MQILASFIRYSYFTQCLRIHLLFHPQSKNTHTHTSNYYKQKANGHVTSLATTNKKQVGTSHRLLMVISLAQTLLACAKFRPLRVRKKRDNFADWLWGRPQALIQRHVSSIRVGLANGTKRTPSQNWGNLLSELHVPHKQCLTGISNAFYASFTNIWPSYPAVLLYPQQSVHTLRYTRRHLPSAVPWISEDRLLLEVICW